MEKSPSQRLGSGPTDAEEVKEHHFFYGLDWDKLRRKGYTPPYNPNLVCVRPSGLALALPGVLSGRVCNMCAGLLLFAYRQSPHMCILGCIYVGVGSLYAGAQ